MTRKHGVTDEDVRRETEEDDRNYGRTKDGAEVGGCCLLYFATTTGGLALLAFVPLLSR